MTMHFKIEMDLEIKDMHRTATVTATLEEKKNVIHLQWELQ